MSRVVFRGIQCHACRLDAIQTFVASMGIAIPRTARYLPTPKHTFSTKPARQLSNNDDKTSPVPAPKMHIPWYLQEEAEFKEPASHPLGKRQEIPGLPDSPPPVLKDLLQHISVTIGLDDLALYDLRDLDPPPALGANLIMILGTARSFKHLNVSADRLCRWLRREHKLAPSADGLLGRQELKVKMKRRARRAKLASSVGATFDDADEGIITGWICVNVGNVTDGRQPQEIVRVPGSAGFGTETRQCRIVIQMMTEEKRSQLDLETLWGGLLKDKQPSVSQPIATTSVTVNPEQRRGLSTSPVFRNVVAFSQVNPRYNHLSRNKPPIPTSAVIPSLTSLFESLSALPPSEACRELGSGPNDFDSTLFLRMFYGELSKVPFVHRAAPKLELYRIALERQHPGYTKIDLFLAFQELSMSGSPISETQVSNVLDALLLFQKPEVIDHRHPIPTRLAESDLELCLKVLDHMSLRGMMIFNKDILSRLYAAVGFQVPVNYDRPAELPQSKTTEKAILVGLEDIKNVDSSHKRLRKIMKLASIAFGPKDFPIFLRTHFNQGEFDLFWGVWRQAALLRIPRSKEDYLLLFNLASERGNQKVIFECFSSCVPMMEREEPPVLIDADIAKSLVKCFLILDPEIPVKAERGEPGPLIALWNKCSAALES